MYAEISGASAFKQKEKLFKSCESVADCIALGAYDFSSVSSDSSSSSSSVSICDIEAFGRTCKAYKLPGHEGAHIIVGVLERKQQVELAYLSLSESLAPPNRTNLHCHYTSQEIESKLQNIWLEDGPQLDELIIADPDSESHSHLQASEVDTVFAVASASASANPSISGAPNAKASTKAVKKSSLNCVPPQIPAKLTLSKLRWATLGYQYDWASRSYTESAYVPFPIQLGELSAHLANSCGEGYTITPQAGIVNFYPHGQVMGGHVDDGEEATECPVVSISLGPPCVFLLGGLTKDEEPAAVLLRSGDVIVLGGEARLKFHGVPKVLVSSGPPKYLHPNTSKKDPIHRSGCPRFLDIPLPNYGKRDGEEKEEEEEEEGQRERIPEQPSCIYTCSCGLVSEDEVQRTLKVLNCARINVNLRQVYKQ